MWHTSLSRDQPDITDREFEPPFSEEAFAQIAAMELGRFYRGKNLPFRVDAWKPTLEVLDALTADVVSTTGRGPVIILYPSQLQVYPQLFRQTTREVEKRLKAIDPDDFDSGYPSQVLLELLPSSSLILLRCHTCHGGRCAGEHGPALPAQRYPLECPWESRRCRS